MNIDRTNVPLHCIPFILQNSLEEEKYPNFAPPVGVYCQNRNDPIPEPVLPQDNTNVPPLLASDLTRISCAYYPIHLVSSFFLACAEASYHTILHADRTYAETLGDINLASIRSIFLIHIICMRTVLWAGWAVYDTFTRSVQLFSQKMGWVSGGFMERVDPDTVPGATAPGRTVIQTILGLQEEQRNHPLRVYTGDSTHLRLNHIRTTRTALDDRGVPATVTIATLRDIFNEINFTDQSADLYMSPVDIAELIYNVPQARARLEQYITVLNNNMSGISHIPTGEHAFVAREIKKQVRLSIHKSNQDVEAFRQANGNDPVNYSREVKAEYQEMMIKRHQMVITLLQSTTHCGGRYKSSATTVYDSIHGIDGTLNLQDTLIEGLSVKRKGLLDQIMNPYVRQHSHDANARNAYQTTLSPLLGIADFGGYRDPIAHMGDSRLPTVEVAMQEFFTRYDLTFIHNAVNEMFNDSSSFRDKIIGWIEEKMGDWAKDIFTERRETYFRRISAVMASDNTGYNIEKNEKRLDEFLSFIKEIRRLGGVLPPLTDYTSWDGFLQALFEPEDSIVKMLVLPGLSSIEKVQLIGRMNVLKALEVISSAGADDLFGDAPTINAQTARAKQTVTAEINRLLDKTEFKIEAGKEKNFLDDFLSKDLLAESYLNRQLIKRASPLMDEVRAKISRDPSNWLEESMLSAWLEAGAPDPQLMMDKCSSIIFSPIFQGLDGQDENDYTTFLLGNNDVDANSSLIQAVKRQLEENFAKMSAALIPINRNREAMQRWKDIVRGDMTIADFSSIPDNLQAGYRAADNVRQILSSPEGSNIANLWDTRDQLAAAISPGSTPVFPRNIDRILVDLFNAKRAIVEETKAAAVQSGIQLDKCWPLIMKLYRSNDLEAFINFSSRMDMEPGSVSAIQKLLTMFEDRRLDRGGSVLGRVDIFKQFIRSTQSGLQFLMLEDSGTKRTKALEKFKFDRMQELLAKTPNKPSQAIGPEINREIVAIRQETLAYKPRNGDAVGDEVLGVKEVEALIGFVKEGASDENTIKSLLQKRFYDLAKINQIINGETRIVKKQNEEGELEEEIQYVEEPVRVGKATLLEILKKDPTSRSYQKDLRESTDALCERMRKDKFKELFRPNPNAPVGETNNLAGMVSKPIREEGQPEARIALPPAILEWLLVDHEIIVPQIVQDRRPT